MSHPAAPLSQRSFLLLLGLSDGDAEGEAQAHAARLAGVAAAWPFALVAQGIAAAVLFGAALAMPAALPPIDIAVIVLLAAVPAVGAYALLAFGRSRDSAPHQRTRGLAVAAAGIAAALLSMLWASTRLPVGPLQLGAFVAVAGAIGITTITLHATRAATLGFGAGLVLMLPILSGRLLPSLIALAFLLCLAIATLRLARLDAGVIHSQAQEASEGRLAAKMIAEFEGHGTGWFWEADRHGRLSYISAKVAAELRQSGANPLGRALTDVFRMDSAASGSPAPNAHSPSTSRRARPFPITPSALPTMLPAPANRTAGGRSPVARSSTNWVVSRALSAPAATLRKSGNRTRRSPASRCSTASPASPTASACATASTRRCNSNSPVPIVPHRCS
jgi:hypothetical protein